ncbi:hypothetical protein [Vibrio navarrensis]|nr:hypothetical protein [Vibrio navarrensis]EJB8414098.1 hypothetical protein [Vibrio vulnificus]
MSWYLTGQPPVKPIMSSEREQELLALFSGLSDEQQSAVLELIRVFN